MMAGQRRVFDSHFLNDAVPGGCCVGVGLLAVVLSSSIVSDGSRPRVVVVVVLAAGGIAELPLPSRSRVSIVAVCCTLDSEVGSGMFVINQPFDLLVLVLVLLCCVILVRLD